MAGDTANEPITHPDLVRALAEADSGEYMRVIAIGLRSREWAHEGVFCECATPNLVGDDLMCGGCMRHNQDAERALLRKMASPHELVEGRHSHLGMCGLCTEFENHPVHHGGTKTMKTLWGETIEGVA